MTPESCAALAKNVIYVIDDKQKSIYTVCIFACSQHKTKDLRVLCLSLK